MANKTATPVIVGVAHIEQRIPGSPAEGKEPLQLMVDAVRAAALDTGNPKVIDAATSVRVIRGMWPYKDPARAVAEAIGIPNAESVLTSFGGNFVQSTMNQTVLDMQRGDHDVVVLTGAECGYSFLKARKVGVKLDWQPAPGTPDRMLGEDKSMQHEAEKVAGLGKPIQIYPMFENALRYARGESMDTHINRVSELWSRFSAVAAGNPNAWIREPMSAEDIRTPSASNRPVSFPYPKLMNSNNNVDQAAAVILCSTDAARRLGIAESKWVYPWAGTDAHDHYFVSNRDNLHSSPGIRFAGRRCMELAGVTPDAIDLVDIYSCFPVAVQVAAAELGFDETRPLTVTGGLTFAGGPLNNYVMHSIVRMAQLLREAPDQRGLITANGGYLTKHAFGVYSATPPSRPFRHDDVQAAVDKTPKRDVALAHRGTATVEAYTVMYEGDAPAKGHFATRTDDGRRAWGETSAPELLEAMTREEFCGRRGRLNGEGQFIL